MCLVVALYSWLFTSSTVFSVSVCHRDDIVTTEPQSILRFGVGRDSQGSASPTLKLTARMANSWHRHCWADCQVSTNHSFQGPHINSHFSFLHIKTGPVDSRGGICCSCSSAHRKPLRTLTFDAVVQAHTEETEQKENNVFLAWIILLLFSAGEDYCTIFHWGIPPNQLFCLAGVWTRTLWGYAAFPLVLSRIACISGLLWSPWFMTAALLLSQWISH